MSRILLYDRYDNPLPDLDPRKVASAFYEEELNGEHSIEIDTYDPLDEGTHVLHKDGTSKWREWVIDEPGDEHDGTYSCEQSGTWSMQYDLAGISGSELWASGEAGTHAPVTAAVALQIALSNQSRWEVGNVTVTGYGAASLYDGSVWDYLGKLVEVWGGEMEPRIVVDSSLGVTHRYVDWLAHVGSETATRRFDYGEDCTRIRRRPKPGPRYCGIRPRGGSTATDQDGVDYSNRVGIEEEPSCEGHDLGSPYLYDLAAKDDFKRPDGHGGYEYPTLTVTYDSEDPEEILGLAQVDLHTYTRPEVSYEADVLQFAAAGMDAHGVALGDYVHVVDRKFGVAPLRLEARVTKVRVSMLDESDIKLTIGSFNRLEETIGELVRATTQGIERRIGTIEAGGTIVYLNELLQQLNDELNVLGGHTYIVDGYGLISYDIAVDDPLIGYNSSTGTWASHVTQIMGGGIRIANSKKPSFAGINDWNWRTLIVSGHVAAELVTAVQITAGFIGSANGSFYLDLDNNALSIGNNAQIGDTTVGDLLSDVASAGISKIEYGTSASAGTTPASWSQTVPSSVAKGSWLWIRTTYKNGSTSVTKAYAGTDGTDGSDGVGIKSVVPQYYLSTSSSSATGGSWSASPPTWSSGRYIWARSQITWDTSPATTTTTTAVYDAALTQANQQAAQARTEAAEAAKVATNYLTFNQANGLDVGYSGTSAKTRVNGSGVTIYDSLGQDSLSIATSSVRVGRVGEARVLLDYQSMSFIDRGGSTFFQVRDLRNASGVATVTEAIRTYKTENGVTTYAYNLTCTATDANYTVKQGSSTVTSQVTRQTGKIVVPSALLGTVLTVTYQTRSSYAKAFTAGVRKASSVNGISSMAEGYGNTASGAFSHAEGYNGTANAHSSHAEGLSTSATAMAAHSEGNSTTASGRCGHSEGTSTSASGSYSHSEGSGAVASGIASHAQNQGTVAASWAQTAIGRFNVKDADGKYALIVGNGGNNASRSNALAVRWDGRAVLHTPTEGFVVDSAKATLSSKTFKRFMNVVMFRVVVRVKSKLAKGKSVVVGRIGRHDAVSTSFSLAPAVAFNAESHSATRTVTIATNGDVTVKTTEAISTTNWTQTISGIYLIA